MTDKVKRARPQKKRAGDFHHGNLREAVIEAALRALEDGDPSAVSLRKIAKTLGVSDPAIYRHFANRDAVLAAAGMRGMQAMMEVMVESAADALDPAEVLRAVGRAYVRFAAGHPGWFRLYFSRAYMDRWGDEGDDMHAAMEAERRLKLALAELVDEARVDDSYRAIWGLAHGLSNLVTERAFRRVDTDDARIATADAAIEIFVDALVAGASSSTS